jgi:hypothetical protein
MKQQFFFTDIKDHPVAREYYDKYNQIDAAWKCISREAWDRVNKHLLEYAKNEQIITGTDFRLDSTVCECNIHYPTDSSLLWDCYRVISRNIRMILNSCPEHSEEKDIKYP